MDSNKAYSVRLQKLTPPLKLLLKLRLKLKPQGCRPKKRLRTLKQLKLLGGKMKPKPLQLKRPGIKQRLNPLLLKRKG